MGQKYPIVLKSWRKKWPNLSTYFKYPNDIRRVIYTTDEIDKTFLPGSARFSLRGRPRGEEQRVDWKRRRAAQENPVGLRRPRTRPVSEGAGAMTRRSVHSFFLHVRQFALPDGATPSRYRQRSDRVCCPSSEGRLRPVPWRGACGQQGLGGPNDNPLALSECANIAWSVFGPRQQLRSGARAGRECG